MSVKEFLVKNRKVFVIWSFLGVAALIVGMLVFQPWTESLGVASSPKRYIVRMVFDWWAAKLPLTLLAFSIVAGHEKWLAPRGRYQEGKSYKVFTNYTYAAIGFMSALFAASGILNFNFFDLPAGPATISITFFNPIIGFFTLWIGGVARALIFGTGNPVFWALGVGESDGSTWIWLGIFYWWFRENTKWGKNPLAVLIFYAVVYVIFRTIYMFDIWVWLNPVPALWARMVWFFSQFIPSGLLASIAGLIAAEALIRAVERPQQQLKPAAGG